MLTRGTGGLCREPRVGGLLAVSVVWLITACFDVPPVDTTGTQLDGPSVRRVDDFESTVRPSWNLLFPWVCDNWPPDPQAVSCGAAQPGADGLGASQFLDFDLESQAPDDYPGAQLTSVRSGIRLDLSGYDQLAFAAKVTEREPGSVPADLELSINLRCSSLAEVRDNQAVSVVHGVHLVADGAWHNFVLDLAAFTQAAFEDWARILASDCLGSVEAIQVQVGAPLSPWQSRRAAGRLQIDDLELRTFRAPQESGSDTRRLDPWFCQTYREGDDPSDSRADDQACDTTRPAPSLTFDVAYPKDVGEGWSSLCASLANVDSLSHEEGTGILNLSAFHQLSFSAKFSPRDQAAQAGARFRLELGCSTLLPNQYPTVQHDLEVLPEWSTYTFPLESFQPPDYPLGFDDVEGCLAHFDGPCFSTKLEPGEASSGTLSIDHLVFR